MTLRIRVSVTEVDSLRYYMDHDGDDVSALIRRFRRQEPPTEAMALGIAFHEALESATGGIVNELSAANYSFDLANVEASVSLSEVREIKTEHLMDVDGVEVCLVGKVDELNGRIIQDHKLTFRYDPERYLKGFQGPAYLEMFGCEQFIWNVFVGKVDKEAPDRIVVTEFHQLSTYRYPGMEDDVREGVREFVEFAKIHLPERFIREEEEA